MLRHDPNGSVTLADVLDYRLPTPRRFFAAVDETALLRSPVDSVYGAAMEKLAVYVDFDDVLCETAAPLTVLLQQEFGKTVAFEDILEFDLEVSFGLTRLECSHLMAMAHRSEFLSQLPPIPGAVETIRRWADSGIPIAVVTGRPPSTVAASRSWLEHYGVPFADLVFVDKYGREDPYPSCVRALSREEFAQQDFIAAVDDSPVAIKLLAEDTSHHIIVFDRPWNRDLASVVSGIDDRLERCVFWGDVDRAVRRLIARL